MADVKKRATREGMGEITQFPFQSAEHGKSKSHYHQQSLNMFVLGYEY